MNFIWPDNKVLIVLDKDITALKFASERISEKIYKQLELKLT